MKTKKVHEKLHAWRLRRKDHGRRKHVDWNCLFAWLVQTLASTAFLAVSFGAFAACGWGIFAYLKLLPGPEALPVLQRRGGSCYVNAAVHASKALCGKGFAGCLVLWLILALVSVLALSILLDRLSDAWKIRRYDA